MAKDYKPLTEEELKEMHGKLRDQFDYASKMMVKWKEAGYYSEANTTDPEKLVRGYSSAAPIVASMATTAEALVTIEREIEVRESRRNRVHLPKP
jgi:hypothetical protein